MSDQETEQGGGGIGQGGQGGQGGEEKPGDGMGGEPGGQFGGSDTETSGPGQ